MIRRIIASVVALAVVGLVAAYLLATHVTAPPAAITIPPTPQAAAGAQQRISHELQNPEIQRTIQEAAAKMKPNPKTVGANHKVANPHRIATIKLAEADVNTLVRADSTVQARMRQEDVTAVNLSFESPNKLNVHVWVNFKWGSREVTISGNLFPTSDGKVAYKTDATSIGMLPLPSDLSASEIDRAAATFANTAEQNLPISVENVAVVGTNLVLSGPKK